MNHTRLIGITAIAAFMAYGLAACCCDDVDTSSFGDLSEGGGDSDSPASAAKSQVKGELCKGEYPITDKAKIVELFKPMVDADKGLVYLDIFNNNPDDVPEIKKGADTDKPIQYNVGVLCYPDSECSGKTCTRQNENYRTVLMFDGTPPKLVGVFTGLGTESTGDEAKNSKAKEKEWEAKVASVFGGDDEKAGDDNEDKAGDDKKADDDTKDEAGDDKKEDKAEAAPVEKKEPPKAEVKEPPKPAKKPAAAAPAKPAAKKPAAKKPGRKRPSRGKRRRR